MPPPGQAQRAAQKFIVFEHFEKMNTKSVRQSLSEKELAWLENLQPIAPNNLVSTPGPLSPALVNISGTINAQYFASIGGVDYIIAFTTAGGAWAINIATTVATQFAANGTFSNPDCTVWQSQFVLFNDITSSYCAWNGSVFVRQGGVSPIITLTATGANYTSAPTVSISGGSGTGATATATIGTPQVNSINLITGGSQYGPAPNVVFSGGGGSGASATATIDPRGLTSITVEGNGLYPPNSPPTSVQFSGGGGGSGAAGQLHFDTTGTGLIVVASISISNPGSNYTSAPTVTIVGGSPFIQAQAICSVGNGAVTSITLNARGSGYTSAPSISFTGGGSGSGATAAASIGGSGVTAVTLTNSGAGYLASDVLTVGFSGGGGTGATATAHVWPFVTPGTTIAVFQGRVWLADINFLQWSGTQGIDDFNTANASGVTTIKDNDLVHSITALRNFNNYLFIIGDQSIKQIGSISVSGSATLFTIVTLSSDQGTIYPRSCGSYNRVFMFCNSNGIYAVLGSSVQKISDDLDGIFKLIDFSLQPQVAIADINNIHNIMWLVRYNDPLSGPRAIELTFDGKKWYVISQASSNLTSITSGSTLASGKNLTFGSSGTDVTQIVADYTKPASFKLQTALTHHGNAVQRKKIMHAGFSATGSATSGTMNVAVDTDNGTQNYVKTINSGFQFNGFSADGSGEYIGLTLTGNLVGFTLVNCSLEYQEVSRPFAK